MAIRWKEEMMQFETFREAEVWADSIANEIHGRSITGYGTPDFKVATILAFYLAQVSEFRVHTAIFPRSGPTRPLDASRSRTIASAA